jgi:hypothetical protein
MTLADMGDYTTNAEMVAYVASQIPVIDFTAVKSTNGYQKLPGGLILQWGQYASSINSETTIAISFPLAFPNTCLNAQVAGIATSNVADFWVQVSAFTSTTLTARSQNGTGEGHLDGFYWSAIGY